MRNNGSSDHHQNNNLKVVIIFGNFISKDISFYGINKKEQVLEFLNTKVKRYHEDPDKRWLTTWNKFTRSNMGSPYAVVSLKWLKSLLKLPSTSKPVKLGKGGSTGI